MRHEKAEKSIENKGVQPVRRSLISINYYFNDYYYFSPRPVLMFNHQIWSSNLTTLLLNKFLFLGLLKKSVSRGGRRMVNTILLVDYILGYFDICLVSWHEQLLALCSDAAIQGRWSRREMKSLPLGRSETSKKCVFDSKVSKCWLELVVTTSCFFTPEHIFHRVLTTTLKVKKKNLLSRISRIPSYYFENK